MILTAVWTAWKIKQFTACLIGSKMFFGRLYVFRILVFLVRILFHRQWNKIRLHVQQILLIIILLNHFFGCQKAIFDSWSTNFSATFFEDLYTKCRVLIHFAYQLVPNLTQPTIKMISIFFQCF